MKKPDRSEKALRYLRAKARYSAKRHTEKWKRRKRNHKILIHTTKVRKSKQIKKVPIPLIAPKNFSLIDNTNEVLAYFSESERVLKSKENIILDVSDVDILTPDTLLLMIASINDKDFIHGSIVSGNAPKKPDLLKLFTESGFYDHVKTSGRFAISKENLLHKEVNKKVVSQVAKEASLTGIRHVFGNEKPFEQLYEILVECMSNTNNHADLHTRGKCNWWLYAYNIPNEKITSYSFLDLGVGIFESAVVKNYIKNLAKGTFLYRNINLVNDLLSGKLQSRTEEDNEIRGKGIPQIVEHSKSNHFKKFYIIANDVLIDLKTGGREQLKHRLNGTFLYWELQN